MRVAARTFTRAVWHARGARYAHSSAAASLVSDAVGRIRFESPVPSDIEISQSVEPYPIGRVAEAAGLLPEELVPYGDVKAKVGLSTGGRSTVCHLGVVYEKRFSCPARVVW